MFFKNALSYRFTKDFNVDPEELAVKLEENAFKPCGPQEASRQGWVAPLGKHGQQFVHVTNGYMMICLKKESRILPESVVKEFVADKVALIEQEQDRKVGKKEKDQIKEEIVQELLPKAFTKSNLTFAFIAPKDGFIVVNSSSANAAEDLTSYLRKSIGSLPIRLPVVQADPSTTMTSWIGEGNSAPDNFRAEEECQLVDKGEDGGVVTCKGVELDGDEINTNLEAGKVVVKLALTYTGDKDETDDRVSFILNEDLSIKRIKFTDLVAEEVNGNGGGGEDAASRFDASFAIASVEIVRLLKAVYNALGGEDRSAFEDADVKSA